MELSYLFGRELMEQEELLLSSFIDKLKGKSFLGIEVSAYSRLSRCVELVLSLGCTSAIGPHVLCEQ